MKKRTKKEFMELLGCDTIYYKEHKQDHNIAFKLWKRNKQLDCVYSGDLGTHFSREDLDFEKEIYNINGIILFTTNFWEGRLWNNTK